MCGFYGHLDTNPVDLTRGTSFADWYPLTAVPFGNYSPNACDAVTIYPISGRANPDPASVDWNMSAFLPLALNDLLDRGWNPATQPLVGMPQAYYENGTTAALPRSGDVIDQTVAFCKAGASAMFPFVWDYKGVNYGGTQPLNTISNTAALREGALEGIRQCQFYWSSYGSGWSVSEIRARAQAFLHPVTAPNAFASGDHGTFEGNVDSFGPYGAATVARDTTTAHSGAASLKISSTAWPTGAQAAFPQTATGTTYTYSFFGKAAVPGKTIYWNMQSGDGDLNCLYAPSAFPLTTSWQRYSATCAIDKNKPLLYLFPSPNSTVWIDDIQLQAQ